MKKIIFLLFMCLMLVGCPSGPKILSLIDLRNKDLNGNITRSVVTSEFSYSYEGLDQSINSSTGPLTEEDVKSLITFSDDPNGFRVTYTDSPKLDNYTISYIDIHYIDGNENFSTKQNLTSYCRNEFALTKETFSWVYPLVNPGKTYKFSVRIKWYCNENTSDNFTLQIFYNITPTHGIGMIDDLPRNYDSSDYVTLENKLLTIHDVIPVESTDVVEKQVQIFGKKTNSDHWITEVHHVKSYRVEITSFDDNSAITFDFSNENLETELPYLFCQFMYTYTLEGYDYCKFYTPEFLSPIVKSSNLTD